LSITDAVHANTPPELTSLPIATPNPALLGTTIEFAVVAADSDGDSLVYTWDFGDGTLALGATAVHKYAAEGVYEVKASVSDGLSSDSATIHVSVVSSLADDNDPASGGASSSRTPNKFRVRKASLRFNLRAADKDSISLSGDLPIMPGTSIDGQIAHFTIADVSRVMQLNARGRGSDKTNSFKLSGKIKNSFVARTPVRFSISMKTQSLAAEFENYIFQDEKGAFMIEAPVLISIGNADWQVDVVRFTYNPATGSTRTIPRR
jgi:PKD repeat protein